ncbi:hypothetical protein GCM10027445_50550 [Amycolatopsis endophytica]|uniref:Uncharacterized protein n=1 Tax=Amycolatopsis endophytica TaxID=860233 RepID=A0A853AZ94_9PSEU|nr:hypothetical protein [Amycolatopsis endophytica]NYI87871.1 hypothetical protein [Amycolatopsis endophytica]
MFGKNNRKPGREIEHSRVLELTGRCAGCGKRTSRKANCCGKPACSRRIASQL